MANEKKILNSIVDIKFNYQNKVSFNEKKFTFIFVDSLIQIQVSKDDWKSIYELVEHEQTTKMLENEKIGLSDSVISLSSTFNVNNIKINGDDSNTKVLQDTITRYFLEGGDNLHLVKYQNGTPLLEKYPYSVGIILSTTTTNINNLIETNFTKKIIYILANKPETNTILSKNLFYLETTDPSWLSHTAAYLNNLSLDQPIKNYSYTQTKTILPTTIKEDCTTLNCIVNIGGNGVTINDRLVDGRDLVNTYMLGLLEDKIRSSLLNILVSKPSRYEITGKIHNELSNILNRFYDMNGVNEEIYSNPPYKVIYNGKEYPIVNTGELVSRGYLVHIVDIYDTSSEDLTNRKMTPITIILMMQKQIKTLTLNMEVN